VNEINRDHDEIGDCYHQYQKKNKKGFPNITLYKSKCIFTVYIYEQVGEDARHHEEEGTVETRHTGSHQPLGERDADVVALKSGNYEKQTFRGSCFEE
jgi:hypothetical protein